LKIIKLLVVNMGGQSSPRMEGQGRELLLSAQHLAVNLCIMYRKTAKDPAAHTTLNEILLCLNFIAAADYSKLGEIISGDELGLSSIVGSLDHEPLQQEAAIFLDRISKHPDGLIKSYECKGAEMAAKALAMQVRFTLSCEKRHN